MNKEQQNNLKSWLTVMTIRIMEDSPHQNIKDNLQYHFEKFVYRHNKEFKLSMMEREQLFEKFWYEESGFSEWGKND